MFETKLRSKLSNIFDDFDINQNGKISPDEINLDVVSTEILVIFKPLLIEMENFDEELDRGEFVESSIALLEKADI